MARLFLTMSEARDYAERLGAKASRSTVRRWVDEGLVETYMIGDRRYVERSSLRRFLIPKLVELR